MSSDLSFSISALTILSVFVESVSMFSAFVAALVAFSATISMLLILSTGVMVCALAPFMNSSLEFPPLFVSFEALLALWPVF